jgi:hypothetical protein
VAGISVAFIIAAVLFVIHFLRQKTLAQKKLAEYHAYHRQYEKMVDSASLSTLQQAPTLEANNAHATFPFAVDHTDHAVPKMYTLRAPSPDLGTNSEHSAEVPAHPAYHPGLRSREDLRLRQENPTPPEPVPDSEVAGMVNLPIFLDTPQRQQFGHMSPQSIVSGRGQQMSPQSIVSDRGQQMSPQSIISGRGQYMSPQSINATADQFSPQSFRSLPMRDPTPMTSPSGQSMSFMSRQLSPLGSIKSGIAMGSISHGMSVPTSSKRMDRKKSSKHRRAAPSKLEISAPVHMTEPRFQDVPLNGAPQVSKTPKHSRFWALMSPQQPPQSATSAIW